MTGQLHFHYSLSCTGEGNGNPLQYSCLENPRDRRAWWAAVTQSWTRLKRLSSSSTSGQESLRRNGVAMIVNKRVQNAVLGCNLKNERMISVCFQGKPFNIIVIQVYAPTSNAEEAEVERFYEDLQDLLEHPKKMSFHYRGLECKSRRSRNTWSNRQIWPWSKNEAGQRLIEFCQENTLIIANTLFQ